MFFRDVTINNVMMIDINNTLDRESYTMSQTGAGLQKKADVKGGRGRRHGKGAAY